MSAGTQNEIERLWKERDHYKGLAESRLDGAIAANARAEQLEEVIQRLRTMVTHGHETKDSFIGRVRQILDEAP